LRKPKYRSGGKEMVKKKVRAKNREQAIKRARERWPNFVVDDARWIRGGHMVKGEKLYHIITHRRVWKK